MPFDAGISRSAAASNFLPTAYCLLLTAYCLLLTAYFPKERYCGIW